MSDPGVRRYAHEIVGGNSCDQVSEGAQTMMQMGCLKIAMQGRIGVRQMAFHYGVGHTSHVRVQLYSSGKDVRMQTSPEVEVDAAEAQGVRWEVG